jgi:hypothetical protein
MSRSLEKLELGPPEPLVRPVLGKAKATGVGRPQPSPVMDSGLAWPLPKLSYVHVAVPFQVVQRTRTPMMVVGPPLRRETVQAEQRAPHDTSRKTARSTTMPSCSPRALVADDAGRYVRCFLPPTLSPPTEVRAPKVEARGFKQKDESYSSWLLFEGGGRGGDGVCFGVKKFSCPSDSYRLGGSFTASWRPPWCRSPSCGTPW